MTTVIDPSTTNDVLLQNIRHHLRLVLHTNKCLQREQAASENTCPMSSCVTMRSVLQHMTKCDDVKNCTFPDCIRSRYVISHWKNCTIPTCPICPLPKSSSTKAWQQQIDQSSRNRLIKQIFLDLLNIVEVNHESLSSDQFAGIQKLAENIENRAFNTATDGADYFPRAIDQITTIREAYVNKHTLNKEQLLATTSSSFDHMKEASESLTTKTETPVVDRHLLTISGTNKGRIIDQKQGDREYPASIEAASGSLPKHPAVFSSDEIHQNMRPVLNRLHKHKLSISFRQPVTQAIAPGYFDIIKHPMDFSAIFKKFDQTQYTTPLQFCEDMWLVFNNAWTYNKKADPVYKAAVELSKVFMKLIDPIMKNYGYCCGRQYVFLPPAMFCYGVGGICCTIPRDGDYFVYNNLSGDQYTFCKKCFDSVKSEYILVGDDPAQTLAELPKVEFNQAKNDHQEQETMVDCIVCSRRFHNICVLYHEHIWPEGYVCKTCVQQYNIKRKDNRYLARNLPTNDLGEMLEKRVNDFRKKYNLDTDRVTIRVLAASDRVCEVKPRFKKHFGAQISDGYPYRTKAIFAFQEIEGVDVVLFGMYAQEYDSRCPGPNSKRVYISYLDSVHYFRPASLRTEFYHELLIGYLEYVKQLGFVYAHIWACPPSEGDDYIFYCHPMEQRVPKPKRLQEWYKTMLDIAIQRRVVVDYKDMKGYADSHIKSATDIPYFEGDFLPTAMEDLLGKFETTNTSGNENAVDPFELAESADSSQKRKLRGDPTDKKKSLRKTTSQPRIDLFHEIKTRITEQRKSVFVVRLRDSKSNPIILTDTDPLIQCDLMESRDAFLSFARDKHCEFSTTRRAEYSTMVLLFELFSSVPDKIIHTCDGCKEQCDVRYHCTICEDYDLCTKCYTTIKHEHRMDYINRPNGTAVSSGGSVDTLHHTVQCQDVSCPLKDCAEYKKLIQHTKECTKVSRTQCTYCNRFHSCIELHAQTCTDQNCPLPYCAHIKNEIQHQCAEKVIHQQKILSGSSSLDS